MYSVMNTSYRGRDRKRKREGGRGREREGRREDEGWLERINMSLQPKAPTTSHKPQSIC
jgi:hypothetical protein